MAFTERMRVAEFAGRVEVTPAQVIAACRRSGISVAAAESVLDPRECEILARALGWKEPTAPESFRPSRARPTRRIGSVASSPTVAPAGRRVISAAVTPPPLRRRAADPAEQAAWDRVATAYASGAVVRGRVTEVVKGGAAVDIGVRAFLPKSQAAITRLDDLRPLVGTVVTARVIDFDRGNRNVVLSRKVVLDEEQARRIEQLRASLEPGQRRGSTIAAVRFNGIVVDLGALTIWIPRGELGIGYRERVEDCFRPGDVAG